MVERTRAGLSPGRAFVFRLAWVGGVLALLRGALLFALERAHHGDAELARLRLGHAWAAEAGVALAIGALAALVGAGLDRKAARLVPRLVAAFLVAALCHAVLTGRFDADLSRRVGGETSRGLLVLAAASLAAGALGLCSLIDVERWRTLTRHWPAVLAPLVLVAAGFVVLRPRGLPATMVVREVLHELVLSDWEPVQARADAPPGPGVISPASTYKKEGAGRPSLVLAPPASVALTLPADRAAYHLQAGVGIDHGPDEESDDRLVGHSVLFRARVDQRVAFEAKVPVRSSETWVAVGGQEGLVVPAGARVELETTLLDAAGNETVSADPVRAGFGGLNLVERREVPRAAASAREPNVVLVLLDTLRADRTSVHGCERETTPHLAALARRGVVFEEAHSTASWTWPSTASILTGRAPEDHGVQDAGSSFLSERLDTLAEALQRRGVTTGAWSGSPLITPDKNFDQGFEFFDSSADGVMRRSDLFLAGALEWLESVGDRRFFLYLHLMEPHAPPVPLAEGRRLFASEVPGTFDPRRILDVTWELRTKGFAADGTPTTEAVFPSEQQGWTRDLYDACTWSADDWLGRVLARLDELGLTENTIVAVTSDHGEELFEHGLLGHGHALSRELVHVPLVLAGPGIARGERRHAPVSNAALGPTLAILAGASIAGLEDEAVDLFGPEPEAVWFSTRQGWWNGRPNQALLGVRQGDLVLHWAPDGSPWGQREPAKGGQAHLFDLGNDPGERDDLAARRPELVHERLAELARRLARLESRRTALGGFEDAGTAEVMRKIGYAE